MVWLPEKNGEWVLRFELEASERWMNVGFFERLLPLPYSQASCSHRP
jgi:hypothetical protein